MFPDIASWTYALKARLGRNRARYNWAEGKVYVWQWGETIDAGRFLSSVGECDDLEGASEISKAIRGIVLSSTQKEA